jgi:hypothetical protein
MGRLPPPAHVYPVRPPQPADGIPPGMLRLWVEQVLSVANEATLWRFDTATYAAHLCLPDQDASTNGGTGEQLAQLRDLYRLTAPRSTKRSY